MGTFTYYNDIPAANNNPSSDQPKMTNNTNVIDQILDVDHYTFETADKDGEHKQINFPFITAQGAQTDPASVIHTTTGTVTTKSECYFKNQNASFLISGVRAFGSFLGVPAGTTVGTTITPTTQSNVSTIENTTSTGNNRKYIVNLSSGATITNSAVVLIFINDIAFLPSYTLVANVLTITCSLSGLGTPPINMAGNIVNFVILQV